MTQDRTEESVWDYPRPPRIERTGERLQVLHRGIVVADTTSGLRILETSHPPVYYIPPDDIARQFLCPAQRRQSFCEFKGLASYWDLNLAAGLERGADDRPEPFVREVAWSYPAPSSPYAALRDHVAFYAGKVDMCLVDGERVTPQAGDFYGGWITARIKGPFKGAPGTLGW